jgi:hypothetical protein
MFNVTRSTPREPRCLLYPLQLFVYVQRLKDVLTPLGEFSTLNEVSYEIAALQKFSMQLKHVHVEIIAATSLLLLSTYIKSVDVFVRKQDNCIVKDIYLIDIASKDPVAVSTLNHIQNLADKRKNKSDEKERRLTNSAKKLEIKSALIVSNQGSSVKDVRSIMMAESDDDSDFVSIVHNTIRPPPQNDITICYSSEEDVDDDVVVLKRRRGEPNRVWCAADVSGN